MSLRLIRFIGVLIIPFAAFAMNSNRVELSKMRRLPHPELLKARLYRHGLDELIESTDVIEKLSGKEKNLPTLRFDIGLIITAYDKSREQHGKHKLTRKGASRVGREIFEACLEGSQDYRILLRLWRKLRWNLFW
jgi:hypothetical protein